MTTLFERDLPRMGRQEQRYYGKYRGLVVNNDDPLAIARIQATVPELLGGEATGWALPSLPYAGEKVGLHLVPPPGAGVWIEFEAGDVSRPIWSGCWWSEGQPPAPSPATKILRSATGLTVALDDDEESITVSDGDGTNFMTIKSKEGTVTLSAKQKVVIESPFIDVVQGASHPTVFGDDLLKWLTQFVTTFNTHMHAGQMAAFIPVTPMIPATPQAPPEPTMLSMKVKAG
ncbi:MAG TPA: phage baseplate assembly protein V [Thermoanaerobaculia bacterium]